jgi:phage internal scaffolding protein
MKRFGQVPNMPENFAMPRYGDFTGLDDYQSAIGYVRASGEAFMALPADLRARFHNDPSEILAFMDVEANRAEAIELGLLPKEAAADRAAAPAPVVPSSGGDEGASSAPLTQSTT